MPAGRAPVVSLQQARNLQLAAQGRLRPAPRAATPAAVRRCIAAMQLLQIDTIHVVARSPYLVLFSRLGHYPMAWLDQALAAGHVFETTLTTVVSPFDPLVWDRERVSTMFGFDYRIECYTPADQRSYGYFVLPLLHCGQLVGRLDAKVHRSEGLFELKAFFLEPGVDANDELLSALAGALWRCARWHGATRLRLVRTSPSAFAPRMRRALRQCEQEIQ